MKKNQKRLLKKKLKMKDRILFLLEILFLMLFFKLKLEYLDDYHSGIFFKVGVFLFISLYVGFGIKSNVYKVSIILFHLLMGFVFCWHVFELNWFYYNSNVIFFMISFLGVTLSIDFLLSIKKACKD